MSGSVEESPSNSNVVPFFRPKEFFPKSKVALARCTRSLTRRQENGGGGVVDHSSNDVNPFGVKPEEMKSSKAEPYNQGDNDEPCIKGLEPLDKDTENGSQEPCDQPMVKVQSAIESTRSICSLSCVPMLQTITLRFIVKNLHLLDSLDGVIQVIHFFL